ncbi:MAG TPA: arsenate reductase (glutaredoxin) [Aliiroseovarius sp.]|nr:arsenate reductase (glutaredoxin) [Aliiroseovarius sp.]
MNDIVIWHNPRCSKSRQTLALLTERGLEVRERRYLTDAPDAGDIRAALKALDLPAIAMMRPKEKLFRELGLSKDDPDEALIAAMAAHPVLIERPIVFTAGKARIGRPPENVLALFQA